VLADHSAGAGAQQPNQTEASKTGAAEKDVAAFRQLPFDGRAKTGYHTVAFSPDGKHLAAPALPNTIKVWDTATGKEVFTLTGHTNEVFDVAFSPDGKWIASAGRDGARLWAAATGKHVFLLRSQTWVNRVGFSPDGKHLASAGSPGIVIWDVATGKQLVTLQGHRTWESTAVFSPDGKHVASGNIEKNITVWDAPTGQVLHTLKGHTGPIHTVIFSPEGKHLASASTDTTIRIWDLAKQEAITLRGHTGPVHTVEYSPDGRRILSASSDKTIRLWDARTGQHLLSLTDCTVPAYCAVFSPDGSRVAATSSNGQIFLWNLGAGGRRPVVLTGPALQSLWDDLGGDHPARAFRAVFTLSAAPNQAVPLLKKHLRPAKVSPVDGKRTAALLADLDSSRYGVRHKATRELGQLGKVIEPALTKALAGPLSLEARWRIESIVNKLQGMQASPEQLLAQRAAEVLERIGTAKARAFLTALAQGAEGAWLTQEAKASLDRLARQPAPVR
jgi:tricorn protease-like protein